MITENKRFRYAFITFPTRYQGTETMDLISYIPTFKKRFFRRLRANALHIPGRRSRSERVIR